MGSNGRLTKFQLDALTAIGILEEERDRGPKGLEVKELLQEHLDREVRHGRLYPNLDCLADLGLIQKGTLDKRTNEYTVTDRGHRERAAQAEWYSSALPERRDA